MRGDKQSARKKKIILALIFHAFVVVVRVASVRHLRRSQSSGNLKSWVSGAEMCFRLPVCVDLCSVVPRYYYSVAPSSVLVTIAYSPIPHVISTVNSVSGSAVYFTPKDKLKTPVKLNLSWDKVIAVTVFIYRIQQIRRSQRISRHTAIHNLILKTLNFLFFIFRLFFNSEFRVLNLFFTF